MGVRRASVALFALMVVSLGCSSGDSPASTRTGTLRVEITDAPADEVSEINVYIVGLTVKPSGEPVRRVAADIGLVDLLTLTDGRFLEIIASVDVADYDHLRIDLDQTRSNVVEKGSGAEKPLKIASEEVKVNGGFTVRRDRDTTIGLDFDARRSLRRRGNGDWLLVPVIVRTKLEEG